MWKLATRKWLHRCSEVHLLCVGDPYLRKAMFASTGAKANSNTTITLGCWRPDVVTLAELPTATSAKLQMVN